MKTLLAVLSMIPGLTATPPLPPRTVDTSYYKDFETTLVEKYADNREQYSSGTCYKVNVKNTGEGYIKDIHFKFESSYYSYKTELAREYSSEYVVAPNQEETFIVSVINYDTDNLDDFEIYANAYTAFTDELTVTGSKTMTVNKLSDRYYYNVDMSFGHNGKDQYCYGAIIKVYIDDQETYFIVNEWENFSFSTCKEAKGNDNGEVEIVKLLKTEYIGYEQERSQEDFFYRVRKGCNGSILCSVPAITSMGVITTFVVALRRTVKKNKSK